MIYNNRDGLGVSKPAIHGCYREYAIAGGRTFAPGSTTNSDSEESTAGHEFLRVGNLNRLYREDPFCHMEEVSCLTL